MVWQSLLDGRYDVRVTRTDHPYRGTLTVQDTEAGETLLTEEVSLSYGAAFGPDVADVEAWADRAVRVVDAHGQVGAADPGTAPGPPESATDTSDPDRNPDEVNPLPYHGVQAYTVVLDYAATGEGMTQQVAVVMAQDARGAQKIFLALHGHEGETQEEFGLGLVVSEGVDAAVLGQWLTPQFIAALERTVAYGEFTLHWHFNLN